MKRKFLSAALAMMVTMSATFAAINPVINEEVQEAFQKEFAGAESVRWSETGEYTKASFVYQGCSTEAYFNKDGELQGTVRAVFFSQLPLAAVKAVNKKFTAADVLDVYEINNDNGTSYRLTLISQKSRYKVTVDADGSISEKTKVK